MRTINKNTILLISIILGLIIGCWVGVASQCPIELIIMSAINGVFLGYLFGLTVIWQKYNALIWCAVIVLITLVVNWVAGSIRVNKLEELTYVTAGLFLGLDYHPLRKETLIGGLLFGIAGFIWGMNDSLWFGYIYLESGWLNASLLSVKGFIVGMFLGGMYFVLFNSSRRNVDAN